MKTKDFASDAEVSALVDAFEHKLSKDARANVVPKADLARA